MGNGLRDRENERDTDRDGERETDTEVLSGRAEAALLVRWAGGQVGVWVGGGWQAGDGSGPGLWPAKPGRGVRDLIFKILCTALICFCRKETGGGSRAPLPHEVMQLGR